MDTQRRPNWRKPGTWLAGAGALLIVVMVGAELLPNTRPGIGPLQIVGIVAGALLIGLSRISASGVTRGAIVGLSLVATILALEFGVGLLGYAPDYSPALVAQAQEPLQWAPYWQCDATAGCRYIRDMIPESICPADSSEVTNRMCIVNSQGYADADEFVATPALAAADYRVMLLGDSFTFGASADYGRSWADLLEAHLQSGHDAVVWNFGTPGTGTRQALVTAHDYVPIMKPDVVVLAFFNNDFQENLYPLDLYVSPWVGDGYKGVYAYELDSSGQPARLDDPNIFYRASGKPASHNPLEALLRQTRLGSLAVDAISSLPRIASPDASWNASVETTRALLGDLKAYLDSQGVPLVVLNIPSIDDAQSITRAYTTLVDISSALGLYRLDVQQGLTTDDYVPVPDGHWTNSGHEKAGAVVNACLDYMADHPGSICPEATP